MAKKTARKGSKENPITKEDLENLATKIAGRGFSILKASLKDDFCNYKYEITSGIGIGDSHNVDGAGIIKDELRESFGKLHVHLAALDGIFKAANTNITDIDLYHDHEFTMMYRIESFEIKGRKGADHVILKGTKYSSNAGGWFNITSPLVALDSLGGYQWYNELKDALEKCREEVAKYREGNYIPVKEDDSEDKDQGSLFDNPDGKTEVDESLSEQMEGAKV